MDASGQPPNKKAKKRRADLNGWCPTTYATKFKNMHKNKPKGDWRRDTTLHSLKYKIARINWSDINTFKAFSFDAPIPVGMEQLLLKLEKSQNRTFKAIPLVVEEFELTENKYKSADFKVQVTFSEPKFGDFRVLYCRLCSSNASLKAKFWDRFPDKLPNEVSLVNLMANWDSLDLSWNYQDVLGCLLPNNADHYAAINARRFIQRPIEHYITVHETPKKGKYSSKTQLTLNGEASTLSASDEPTSSLMSSLVDSDEPQCTSSLSLVSSTAGALSKKNPTPVRSMKSNYPHSQLIQPTIESLIFPEMDFVGNIYVDLNNSQRLALGHALKVIQVGAKKMISSQAVLENYRNFLDIQKEQYNYYRYLNSRAVRQGTINLPMPIEVRVNDHNINKGYEALLESYRFSNSDSGNPYRILDQADHWGIVHDATSHWVKQINTVFVRAVSSDGEITPVPFRMKQVAGSLTGEVLAEDVMLEICNVKEVKKNAASRIEAALKSSSSHQSDADRVRLESCRTELQEAALNLDLDKIDILKGEICELQSKSSITSIIDKNTVIPTTPHYFKISKLQGVDHERKVIDLMIEKENVPTSVCGDNCATNKKACRLMKENYGLQCPVGACASHVSSGTIRRITTSKTMSDPEAVKLYNSLRKILKHFSLSAKSTEMLNNALDMLDQNNIHMLVWGSTRMSGFLDGCKQASSILVPFLDTIIAGNIRQEEAAYILSPKGLFVLQLFADLHPIFADQYLHCVDTDKVLSCEVYNIAGKTANTLISADITTPKADTIFNNLGEDINNDVTVRLIDVQMMSIHTF